MLLAASWTGACLRLAAGNIRGHDAQIIVRVGAVATASERATQR
jgi:hypothetical protein